MNLSTLRLALSDSAATLTAAGAFAPQKSLTGIHIVFPAAATGAVVVNLIREGNTLILASETLTAATTFRQAFEQPIALYAGDRLSLDVSATNSTALAWIDYAY